MLRRDPSLHDSLWHATAAPAPETTPFEGEAQADVAIIGGGFTGCSTALHLALTGKSVILLEAKEFGWGGSGRNMGLVNAGSWLDPEEVIRRAGPVHGQRMLDGLNDAPQTVFDLVERYGIECDLVRKGVIKAAHNRRGFKALEEHARQWQARGANVELFNAGRAEELLGTKRYLGGIIDHRSAAIQPLSYVRGLASAAQTEGARLHTASPVTRLERRGETWRVSTARGVVTAGHVVLATNAYSDDLWPGVKQSVTPIGCYAFASEPLGENIRESILPGGHAMYDVQPVMNFARKDRDQRLMVGSLGYLPRANPGRSSAWVNRMLRRLFPQLDGISWSYKWAGTIGFTPDHLPRLHEPAENLIMTLGYNGRGIAPGTFWGQQITARIVDGKPLADMPLPVTPVRPIRRRVLWQAFYESAFSAYRLRNLIE
ncbi:MAG: FAD-binding oxidoreductase [Rhodospirillaceae bacterium]|jgi:glycine/D-amino acid oxidase-like deaminating enzyme|nr:FAD-binding oxidoreductase [Rhodospirillaceae bacterium]